MIGLPKDNAGLCVMARACAEAQGRLAASAAEDREHWHHRLLEALLTELADRISRPAAIAKAENPT